MGNIAVYFPMEIRIRSFKSVYAINQWDLRSNFKLSFHPYPNIGSVSIEASAVTEPSLLEYVIRKEHINFQQTQNLCYEYLSKHFKHDSSQLYAHFVKGYEQLIK